MNIHEYGVGGTRRGRRISGSKKSPIMDVPYSQNNGGNEFQPNEALAFLQVF